MGNKLMPMNTIEEKKIVRQSVRTVKRHFQIMPKVGLHLTKISLCRNEKENVRLDIEFKLICKIDFCSGHIKDPSKQFFTFYA